jgi:hypothetical protein
MTDAEALKYYSHPKMQDKFRERMGEALPHDNICCKTMDWIKHVDDCAYSGDESCNSQKCPLMIRLPLPIDPRNPERGLWGMVDWKFTDLEVVDNDGAVSIVSGDDFFYRGSLELALLKALAHQWEVKVK